MPIGELEYKRYPQILFCIHLPAIFRLLRGVILILGYRAVAGRYAVPYRGANLGIDRTKAYRARLASARYRYSVRSWRGPLD